MTTAHVRVKRLDEVLREHDAVLHGDRVAIESVQRPPEEEVRELRIWHRLHQARRLVPAEKSLNSYLPLAFVGAAIPERRVGEKVLVEGSDSYVRERDAGPLGIADPPDGELGVECSPDTLDP